MLYELRVVGLNGARIIDYAPIAASYGSFARESLFVVNQAQFIIRHIAHIVGVRQVNQWVSTTVLYVEPRPQGHPFAGVLDASLDV